MSAAGPHVADLAAMRHPPRRRAPRFTRSIDPLHDLRAFGRAPAAAALAAARHRAHPQPEAGHPRADRRRASPGCRWSSTPCTACTRSRPIAGKRAVPSTGSSGSPPRSATSSSSRTPRTSTRSCGTLRIPARKVRAARQRHRPHPLRPRRGHGRRPRRSCAPSGASPTTRWSAWWSAAWCARRASSSCSRPPHALRRRGVPGPVRRRRPDRSRQDRRHRPRRVRERRRRRGACSSAPATTCPSATPHGPVRHGELARGLPA